MSASLALVAEQWSQVIGYEEYEVSSMGRLRKNGFGVLKLMPKSRGYYRTGLYKNTKPKYFSVHRLVAQAFIRNPEWKPEVNHIDGDKLNNRVENLEWVTGRENQLHRSRVLRICAGESHPNSRLTEADVWDIYIMLHFGASVKDLAAAYDYCPGSINLIRARKTWATIWSGVKP